MKSILNCWHCNKKNAVSVIVFSGVESDFCEKCLSKFFSKKKIIEINRQEAKLRQKFIDVLDNFIR